MIREKPKPYINLLLGGTITAVSIAIFEVLKKPQYIRPFGLAAGVLAAIVIVEFQKYGKRLWFWVTIAVIMVAQLPIILLCASQINDASPLLTISLGILDGIVMLMLIILVGHKLEKKRAAG